LDGAVSFFQRIKDIYSTWKESNFVEKTEAVNTNLVENVASARDTAETIY